MVIKKSSQIKSSKKEDAKTSRKETKTEFINMKLDRFPSIFGKQEKNEVTIATEEIEKNQENFKKLIEKLNSVEIDWRWEWISHKNLEVKDEKLIEEMILKLDKPEINFKDMDGKTPLMICIEKKLYKYARKILMKEPDLNILDSYGNNLLMKLCNCKLYYYDPNKDKHITLEEDAEVNEKLYKEKIQLVREIVKKVDWTYLQRVYEEVEKIDRNVKKIMLEEKLNTSDLDELKRRFGKGEENYLMNICRIYNESINKYQAIKKILEEDMSIDINETNENGETALMLFCSAVDRGWKDNINQLYLDMVELFIERGADLSIKNKNNQNIFIHACIGGNYGIVELLIKKGVDINQKDESKRRGLLYALNINRDIVLLLLENKIKLDSDEKHRTIMDYAFEENDEEMMEIIRKNYKNY